MPTPTTNETAVASAGEKTVLVTGAAVRIGRAIAERFAAAGFRVALHCNRSRPQADALCAELGGETAGHTVVTADLADPRQRDRLLAQLIERGMTPDVLVNNASVYRRVPLRETTLESFHADFEINFAAPFFLMVDFARHCRRGCIVNLLDQRVAGIDPGAGVYGLAKKSLRDATEAAALEWAPDIRVNGVAPGLSLPPPGVDPAKMLPLLREVPMRRATPPEEIAEACLFLVSSATMTGQILYLDGGLHLHPPFPPARL